MNPGSYDAQAAPHQSFTVGSQPPQQQSVTVDLPNAKHADPLLADEDLYLMSPPVKVRIDKNRLVKTVAENIY